MGFYPRFVILAFFPIYFNSKNINRYLRFSPSCQNGKKNFKKAYSPLFYAETPPTLSKKFPKQVGGPKKKNKTLVLFSYLIGGSLILFFLTQLKPGFWEIPPPVISQNLGFFFPRITFFPTLFRFKFLGFFPRRVLF